MIDYDKASIDDIRLHCAALRGEAALITERRKQMRRKREEGLWDLPFFGEVSSSDIDERDIALEVGKEIRAESFANKCDAALVRREMGVAPHPSTKTGPSFPEGGLAFTNPQILKEQRPRVMFAVALIGLAAAFIIGRST